MILSILTAKNNCVPFINLSLLFSHISTFQLAFYGTAELQILFKLKGMVYHFNSFYSDNFIDLT